MLAYETNHLENAEILLQAKKWHKHKFISDEKNTEIQSKYAHPLYSPHLFIRIGLFIFTCISASAAHGLLMAVTGVFNTGSDTGMAIRMFIHGCITLGVLELLIKEKKIYKSGIDDALAYIGVASIFTSICILSYTIENGEIFNVILICSLSLPLFIIATIRYSDMLLASTAFCCLLTLLFFLVIRIGEASKYLLPFFTMFVSAGIFITVLKFRKNDKCRFWDNSLWIIEILSLILFYLAGNYFVVRTASEEFFRMELAEGQDIPLAFVFYAFTALVPLVYIFFGLKNKNRTLLISGLILIAASVLTFKYYYSLGHHEITMTLGGIIMIAVAWFSINYLKTPKYGITYIEDETEDRAGILNAEALIITQTFSGPQQGDEGTKLGGGKFGGGGADGEY